MRKMTTPPKGSGSTRGKKKKKSAKKSPPISNYSSALRWLYEHTDYERMRMVRYNTTTFDLSRMARLLKAIGNPEKQLTCIHIAGSKGKGSTIAMLDAILQESGLTVGKYTSPHLVDVRERIQVNNNMVTPGELTEYFKLIEKKTAKWDELPSFFEIMTACALHHFAELAVDIVILETGLGGRLDCTNVVKPVVCGITQISMDHMNVLGKDLVSIAREKAGIMKKGVPCITVEQAEDVLLEMDKIANEVGAPFTVTGRELEFSYRFEANRELGPHTRVCLSTEKSHYEHLPVPLKGEHQAFNCGLALAIIDKLRELDFDLADEKIITGLDKAKIAGRMEVVWEEPRILLDGAHNAASLKALIKSIGAHIPYDSLIMVFGCALDKDVDGMIREINLGADKIIFTRSKANPRAADPEDLMTKFIDHSGKMAQKADNLEDALKLAASAVSREDIICVTGSFYLVGEAKKHLMKLQEKAQKG